MNEDMSMHLLGVTVYACWTCVCAYTHVFVCGMCILVHSCIRVCVVNMQDYDKHIRQEKPCTYVCMHAYVG